MLKQLTSWEVHITRGFVVGKRCSGFPVDSKTKVHRFKKRTIMIKKTIKLTVSRLCDEWIGPLHYFLLFSCLIFLSCYAFIFFFFFLFPFFDLLYVLFVFSFSFFKFLFFFCCFFSYFAFIMYFFVLIVDKISLI